MKQSVRLWVFRIVTAIGLPLLLVVTVEAGLRLSGYGYPSDFTVPCTVQDRGAFCDNDHFTWQFFPPGAFRLPSAFAIPAEKLPGTFRIFVIGESAAQGDPEPSYSFSRYLEVMLRDRFPAVKFEVINAGITAINSHVLLPVTRDLARHQGDLFVFYTGNNEVVGPFGPGNAPSQRASSLPLIRTGIYLKSTRLGQLVGTTLRRIRAKESSAWNWRGMQAFLDQPVPADAPALAEAYKNFQRNLADIVEVARRSGAQVLVSTVGVNLKDGAPFASLHRPDLLPKDRETWEALVAEGARLETAGQPAEALLQFLSASAIDDRYAELAFRIGRCYWALDKFTEAKNWFMQARDLDVVRFRADSRINEIIRSVAGAAGPGVELIDGETALADGSPHGVTGRELFHEHVHMKPEGNYLLARALFPRVVAMLPEELQRWAGTAEAPSEEEANRLLALTMYDRHRVDRNLLGPLSQPPFTNQLNHDEQLRALQHDVENEQEDPEQTAAAYRFAIARAPADRWLHYNYGAFLGEHDPAAAAVEFRSALDLLPGNYAAREKLAATLIHMGKFDEAIVQCRELLRRMPYHPPAYLTMAYALAQLRSFDESIAAYQQAVRLYPPYAVDAYHAIGSIQILQERFEQAVASLQKALDMDTARTKTSDLLYKLSYALKKLGKVAEAQRALEGAMAADPRRH